MDEMLDVNYEPTGHMWGADSDGNHLVKWKLNSNWTITTVTQSLSSGSEDYKWSIPRSVDKMGDYMLQAHKLQLIPYYGFLQKYLQPHQQMVTVILICIEQLFFMAGTYASALFFTAMIGFQFWSGTDCYTLSKN